MKSNFCFQIFLPLHGGDLKVQLQSIENQLMLWMLDSGLSIQGLLQSRIYLSDAINQWQCVKVSSLYADLLSKGAVSFVEQPMLCGAKIGVQVWFTREANVVKTGTPDCMQIRSDEVMFLFQSVRFQEKEVVGLDSEAQTMLAFRRHMDVLKGLGMNLKENCHRTWIYVRDIDKHYAGVVTGRNKIFDTCGLTADTHYISSTGIGGYPDNKSTIVGIDFLSFDGIGEDRIQYLHALEYLNPTHEYGVAFERGTKVSLPGEEIYFISGTASIDKNGECLHRGEILTQTGRLFLNIQKLLEDGNAGLSDVQYMIVYLRDISDYAEVENYIRLRFPRIPFLIVEARVCRPEWLIEVECIAVR